jgi:phosphoribosylformylglycinamidine (FGAM) synthase-like enzyme
MGWGFGVLVDKADLDDTISVCEKSGVEAETIGEVTGKGRIVAKYKGKTLQLR